MLLPRRAGARVRCLCLETSGEACSVALCWDGQVLLEHHLAPRRHAEILLPLVDGLLKQRGVEGRQLDALAVGIGPGSFTGLRIATGVCQGLAWGWGLPVLRISTLAILAQTAVAQHERVAVALDARLGELYWGLYRRVPEQRMQPIGEPQLCRPEQITVPEGSGWHGLGSGWIRYRPLLEQQFGSRLASVNGQALPDARAMLPLAEYSWQRGEQVSPEQAVPEYLREQVARKP